MDTNVQVSNSAQIAQNSLLADVLDLLVQLKDYMDNRADVEDGDYGVIRPNVEMRFGVDIESQIDAISRAFNVKPQFYKCTVGCCTVR